MTEIDEQKDIKQYSGKNQFITWGLLLLCCFLLAAILLFLYKNNQIGRYALHVANYEGFSFYILDTKTSHVWYRNPHPGAHKVRCYDFGTLGKPTTVEESVRPDPLDLSDLGATREITGEPQ